MSVVSFIRNNLHVTEPVSVSRLSSPDVATHVHFHLKLVGEADARVQHVEPVGNELLERLQLQNLAQERLHVWRSRQNECVRIKRYPLSGLET